MAKQKVRELLVATTNKGKLREIRELLKPYKLKITSLADYSGLPEIIEDGKTFRANAVKKALTIAKATEKLVMGEDSGIEVRALGNRPGVLSARYSGRHGNDKKNNRKMLRELKGVSKSGRQARYRSFIALAYKDKVIDVVSGSCSGLIAFKERGNNGFGYDSLFLIPKYDRTFGELSPDVKSGMSHRSRALAKLKNSLQSHFSLPER